MMTSGAEVPVGGNGSAGGMRPGHLAGVRAVRLLRAAGTAPFQVEGPAFSRNASTASRWPLVV